MRWPLFACQSLRLSSRGGRRAPGHRRSPAVEDLEGRRLPSHAVQPLVDLPAGSFASNILSGPGGDLWVGVSNFGAHGAAAIDRVGLDGSVASFDLPGDVTVDGLVNGPDGDVWFIAEVNPSFDNSGQVISGGQISIGDVTPAGQVTELAPIPVAPGQIGTSFDGEFVSGPGGDLWFSYGVLDATPRAPSPMSQDFIGRVSIAGAVTLFPVSPPSLGMQGMYSLAVGADGDLWFTRQVGPYVRLEKMSPGGVVTRVPVPGLSPMLVTQVARGLHRGLIMTARSPSLREHSILRISPSGVIAPVKVPAAISRAFRQYLGPAGGSLWFTNQTGRRRLLGRISADGAATSYNLAGAIRGRFSRIQSMAAGPDGNLYLVVSDGLATTVDRLAPGKLTPIPVDLSPEFAH